MTLVWLPMVWSLDDFVNNPKYARGLKWVFWLAAGQAGLLACLGVFTIFFRLKLYTPDTTIEHMLCHMLSATAQLYIVIQVSLHVLFV